MYLDAPLNFIEKEILPSLVCPRCASDSISSKLLSEVIKSQVVEVACDKCHTVYSIKDGTINFLPGWLWEMKSGSGILSGYKRKQWKYWREKLNNFEAKWQRSSRQTWKDRDQYLADWPYDEKRHYSVNEYYEFSDFGVLKESDTVLDIGCGVGRLGKYLSENSNLRYVGIDPMPYFIPILRGSFFVAVAEFLPFAYSFFDRVQIRDALDHTIEGKRVFREVFRVLKSGGELILKVRLYRLSEGYRHKKLWNVLENNMKKSILLPFRGWKKVRGTHPTIYHDGMLFSLLEKNGFKIKDVRTKSRGKTDQKSDCLVSAVAIK